MRAWPSEQCCNGALCNTQKHHQLTLGLTLGLQYNMLIHEFIKDLLGIKHSLCLSVYLSVDLIGASEKFVVVVVFHRFTQLQWFLMVY